MLTMSIIINIKVTIKYRKRGFRIVVVKKRVFAPFHHNKKILASFSNGNHGVSIFLLTGCFTLRFKYDKNNILIIRMLKVLLMEAMKKEKDWTEQYFKARGFDLSKIKSRNRKIVFYNVRKKEK